MNSVETFGLGKSYRGNWALRDCTIAVPMGRIVALVGSNGAGKTTLLHCAVGLVAPTTGQIAVLGNLAAGTPEALERVAFVAQEAPLYRHISVRAMLSVARNMNQRFDGAQAQKRLRSLDIPLDRKVGKLSGGQQAQLALTLAFARHPSLLVLDEPLARLDPVARHDVMALVMAAVAEEGLSVIFSSHVISELERVADYLILLARGHVQMAGVIDDLLAEHALLSGPADDAERVVRQFPVVQSQMAARRAQLLVQIRKPTDVPSGWELDTASLDELVLGYLREPSTSALTGPVAISSDRAKKAAR